ncbi:hypothetical protein GOV04_01105 [Candidatus Woesearchaeota archaeon]|nr:hypothetical protein [Candidatus Woesearchaeota archaeon]
MKVKKKAVLNSEVRSLVEDIEALDTPDPQLKDFDHIKYSAEQMGKFDNLASLLGKAIIFTYLLIIIISFICFLGTMNEQCYPLFLKNFEILVLIIIGFFFGTRLIPYYIRTR